MSTGLNISTASGGLLAKLPKREARFVLEKAAELVKPSEEPLSLEGLLRRVVDVFSGKEYGWEEAVIDGLWYRWPSEVRSQRFCSEEALKNWLLLRVLNIPVDYAVIEDYRGTGMAHEIVIAHDRGRALRIDWDDIAEAKIDSNRLSVNGQSHTIAAFLDEDEVLSRVEALRSGKSFLDAIESGQMLYRKTLDDGVFEAFVKYSPANHGIEFAFIMAPFTDEPHLYFTLSTSTDSAGKARRLMLKYELGVAQSHYLMRMEGQCPLLIVEEVDGKRSASFKELEGRLSDDDVATLKAALFYHAARETLGNTLLVTQEDRDCVVRDLTRWSQNTEDPISGVMTAYLCQYRKLMEHSPQAAQQFLDFQAFSWGTMKHYWNQLDSFLAENIGVPKEFQVFAYSGQCVKRLGKALAVENMLSVHNALSRELGKAVGVSYPELSGDGFLNFFSDVQGRMLFTSRST